jgi:tRNA(fMet)-specific endonuclease VapC
MIRTWRYLLDTDVCIEAMKNNAQVVPRLLALPRSQIAVSAISVAELYFGAAKSAHPKKNRDVQEAFLSAFKILDFDRAAADAYATIRAALERSGRPIGERDQMIAATAVSRGLAIATGNMSEFTRVPALKLVDNWIV